MVGFIPLDITDEESVRRGKPCLSPLTLPLTHCPLYLQLETVLQHVDHAMQYGEDLEPKGGSWGALTSCAD